MLFRHNPSGEFVHATDLRHLVWTPRTLIRSLLITRSVRQSSDEQHVGTTLRTRRMMCAQLSLWGYDQPKEGPGNCEDRLLTWRILTLHCCDIANDGSWGRHGLRREYGSSRMHGHCPERPAMVGAEPNKMRLGKLGTCLAFPHASWRAISQ